MKAAVINKYGNQDVFELMEVPNPEPKPHEVLIRVYASSVNPVDWKLRKGNWRFLLIAKFPVILGFDAAGEIVKTGSNVLNFKPGDQVYCRLDRKFGGGYAECAVTSEKTLSIIPENLLYEQAAALPLAGVSALQALRDKGKVSVGKKVLINGASGGVGHFAIQLAKILGGEVTAVASARHEKMMEQFHPHHWIDYTRENFLQSGKKYDIIFDVIGNKSFLKCISVLNPGGVYITSLPRPKLLLHKLVSLFISKKVKGFLMKSKGADLDMLSTLVKNGELKIMVDRVFNLSEIAEAHRYSETGKTEGKIVIKIS